MFLPIDKVWLGMAVVPAITSNTMYLRLFPLLLILLLAISSCTFRRSNPRLMEIECKLDSFP